MINAVPIRSGMVRPYVVTLSAPGTSSIRGLVRYYEGHAPSDHRDMRNVVLLGDVVYSWACLSALIDQMRDCVFAVSHDIGTDAGELWGVAWNPIADHNMRGSLERADRRAPPDPTSHYAYQPGQMRLWLWDVEATLVPDRRCRFVTTDYTTDIDLDSHVQPDFLEPLSMAAAADDLAHGVTW